MSLLGFVVRNIAGSKFKSWVVGLCAAIMAGFVIATTLVLGGARESLNLALERLGADIIVVPAGAESKVENAFLMGAPVTAWMPRSTLDEIASIPGVETVSPQLFLATLRGATCCSMPEMFLIAYEPETDFTLRPWLVKNLKDGLQLGEAIGGSFVYLPLGTEKIKIYGYDVDLQGNLSPTGTGLDQSMFFTFETAREIARLSYMQAERPLEIARDSISAALIKIEPGANPAGIVSEIQARLPGVTPIESSRLFQTQREQMSALLNSIVALLVITWLLALILTGLVFSIAVNERKREIGVLRALGASRKSVVQSLLGEALLVALAGGAVGIGLATLTIWLFRNLIIQIMRVPFLFPGPLALSVLIAEALGLALVGVTLSALLPALRISFQEPAVTMRE
ncbi:MAG TPA: FtsX-like permease family protein [Anaerolineae bacterium]|nr:FtsX-like permease family protein [Anaerolineae bacterium]